ncbi:thiamine-phosphate kinase [Acetobacteraceae bacterium KSS8]|uniref:Thiamine-monophosphate kinase n=1 Tax=Endosaccharibacter trunci TaxID=2812733 RepID=A0ABT1W4Y2_9PROT|nr:thiamine-phosphate kinase [Acetobacteraceae bacterium KSS8]
MASAPEFDFIDRHFLPLAGPGALFLSDDAAVMTPPPGRELVLAADAVVSGVHFLPDDPADTVGEKLLGVNLSDLAAMGAMPLGYLLTVSAPASLGDHWFAGFAAGLKHAQERFGLSLLGGDTTGTPGPLCLSLTILGHVAPGRALRRNGARPGDAIWVTGTIGDAALGLMCLQNGLPDPTGFLVDRYRRPQPRLGLVLDGIASAAIDVSDGLVQDLGHLCRRSGVAAEIAAERVPASPAARAAGTDLLERRLTGGDDYELLLAVPPDREEALLAESVRAGIAVTRIGVFRSGPPDVTLRDASGAPLRFARGGWSHF